jgi:hypothetical protein
MRKPMATTSETGNPNGTPRSLIMAYIFGALTLVLALLSLLTR